MIKYREDNISSNILLSKLPQPTSGKNRVLPEGKEGRLPEIQVGLLHDRWRHHLSPPPQFSISQMSYTYVVVVVSNPLGAGKRTPSPFDLSA
ncbi:hypothetical protein TNCV_5008351 [Trichonephila clavipes]|nr:hypothetical protein TNCV_5008351 [Trichonephila clavipes]